MIAFLLTTVSVFANESCYQVTSVKNSWSRTPELLCVNETAKENEFKNEYKIILKSGMSSNQSIIASFNLSLTNRARCLDCNQDVYSVANPENSSFNSLSIKFNGYRKFNEDGAMEKSVESGVVSIGANKFYYRSY